MIEPIIDEFFRTIEAKPSTIKAYLQGLKHYTAFHDMTMLGLLEESEEDQTNKVAPRKQRLNKRLNDFNNFLIDNEYSQNAKALYLIFVKSFYKNFGVIIPRIGKTKKTKVIKKENQWLGFTTEDISSHLKAHLTSRDRALILLISTSGLAKKEVRNLIRKDFEGAQDPDGVTTFRLRREKTSFDFYTFCSPEATRAIYDYLKSRKDDSKYLFVTEQGKKITPETWTFIFKHLGDRVGYIRNNNQFCQTRSHNYRKWFNSTLQNNRCPVWFVDFCMAHDTVDVRAHYHMGDPEKLKDIYKEYMHLLAIDDKSFQLMKDDEYKKIMQQNKAQSSELDALKQQMNAIQELLQFRDNHKTDI